MQPPRGQLACLALLCAQVLVDKGIPAFAMQSGLSKDDFGWGSATFHKMVRRAAEKRNYTQI